MTSCQHQPPLTLLDSRVPAHRSEETPPPGPASVEASSRSVPTVDPLPERRTRVVASPGGLVWLGEAIGSATPPLVLVPRTRLFRRALVIRQLASLVWQSCPEGSAWLAGVDMMFLPCSEPGRVWVAHSWQRPACAFSSVSLPSVLPLCVIAQPRVADPELCCLS